jgi:curved DNA-binding protein CbpA
MDFRPGTAAFEKNGLKELIMQWNNYYEVLEIERNANTLDIKRAYAARVRKYSNEHFPEEFIKIREAYDVLNDENSRREYDRGLASNDRYNDMLKSAQREIDRNNYETAVRILDRLVIDYPDDRTVRVELDHCLLKLSQTGTVYRSQSPSVETHQSAGPEKKEEKGSKFWGCCICLIIIFVFYQFVK